MIALAFLRVLQEAMHNATKHSRATNITVRLTSSAGYVGLEIYDDGVGFDTDAASLAAGLGLISMRKEFIWLAANSISGRDPDRAPGSLPCTNRPSKLQAEPNEPHTPTIDVTPAPDRRQSYRP